MHAHAPETFWKTNSDKHPCCWVFPLGAYILRLGKRGDACLARHREELGFFRRCGLKMGKVCRRLSLRLATKLYAIACCGCHRECRVKHTNPHCRKDCRWLESLDVASASDKILLTFCGRLAIFYRCILLSITCIKLLWTVKNSPFCTIYHLYMVINIRFSTNAKYLYIDFKFGEYLNQVILFKLV